MCDKRLFVSVDLSSRIEQVVVCFSNMLTAQAKGFLGSAYELADDESKVAARLKTSSWRERATVEITENGYTSSYRFQRQGSVSGAFLLLEGERVVAFAEKPSAFRDRFEISFSGDNFNLRKPSFWKQEFVLERDGIVIGSLVPKGILRRRILVDLPEGFPLIFRIFVFWLALIVWKRHQNAAVAGAG